MIEEVIRITFESIDKIKNSIAEKQKQIEGLTTASGEVIKAFGMTTEATKKFVNTLKQDIAVNKIRSNQYGALLRSQVALSEQFDLDKISHLGFWKTLFLEADVWTKVHKAQVPFITTGGKIADKFRLLTHGIHKFRMELLAIMFFGMNLAKLFGGMTKGAIEMLGITEYLGAAIDDIVVTALLPMSDAIFWLIDQMFGMDEGQKQLIGTLILLGQAFGMIFQFIGSLMLGLGGLIQFFGYIPAGILKILGPIGSLLGISETGFLNLGLGMSKAFDVLKEIGGAFSGVIDWVKEWAGKAIDLTVKFAKKGWDLIETALDKIWGVGTEIGKAIWELAVDFKEMMGDAVGIIGNFFSTKLGKTVAFAFGTGLIIHSFLSFQGAQGDIKTQIIAFAEAALGGAFISQALGMKGKAGIALFSVGVALMVTAVSGDIFNNILNAAELALGAAFVGFKLAGPYGALFGVTAAIFLSVVAPKLAEDIGKETERIKEAYKKGKISTGWGVGYALAQAAVDLRAYLGSVWRGLGQIFGGWQQAGGIVTRPTLVGAGEAGPEAIIPLSKLGMIGTTNNYYNITPTYDISARIDNDMDIRTLAEKLNSYMVSDYRRLAFR